MRPDLYVTHENKAYLVWLMFRMLSNQHYPHRANQKLRSCAKAVYQNRGVCGQAVPSFPSPVIHFFFRSCPSFLDEPREETLAAQATGGQGLLRLAQAWSLATFIWNIREIEWNENLRCSIPSNTTTTQPSYKVSLIHYFFIAGWLTSSAAQYIFAIVMGQLTEIF